MQITVRAIPDRELAGLKPSALADRLLLVPGEDDGAFADVPGIDVAWRSDSMLLHTAFFEDVGASGDATPLLAALIAAFARDDLGLRDVPQLEDTVGASWSAATVADLRRLDVADGTRPEIALDAMQPSDDEVTSADYIDYLRQVRETIRIAAAAGAAIVIFYG